MALELKTGHSQRVQSEHALQLALYTMMLELRYGSKSPHRSLRVQQDHMGEKPDPQGASKGGALLYLNANAFTLTNVSLSKKEMKSLIGNRNNVASDTIRAGRPRGVELSYEEEDPVKNKKGGQR